MSDSSKCFKCGKPGHWARACRTNKRELLHYVTDKQESIKNKVTRCFICRKLGHLARECPSAVDGKYYDLDTPMETSRRNEEAPPPPNFSMDHNPYGELDGTAITQAFDSIEERDWDFIKNENLKDSTGETKYQGSIDRKVGTFVPKGGESKYNKVALLSNTKFNSFLDTCSEKCLIKYSAAKKANLKVQLDDTDVMVNSPTFKGKVVSIGKAVTVVSVDAVEVSNVEMFVVSDDVLNIEVVIGRSWLDHPHVIFLKIDTAVYLGDMTVHPFDKFRSILSNLDIKTLGKKNAVDTRLDAVTSSEDEDISKSTKPIHLLKKRHHSHSKSDYKDSDEAVTRKHSRDLLYERERGRDAVRVRSRSRERVRMSVRDDRMEKFSERPRRSRERSRDRYLSRHTGRH